MNSFADIYFLRVLLLLVKPVLPSRFAGQADFTVGIRGCYCRAECLSESDTKEVLCWQRHRGLFFTC